MVARYDASAVFRTAEALAASPARLELVTSRALATLGRAIKPEAKRQIQKEYNLASSAITDRLVSRTLADAVELSGYYRAIGLLNFGATASRSGGVAVTVMRSDGMQRLRHAFKAQGLNGNTHIFERAGRPREMKKGKYIGQVRQPLVAKFGPAVSQGLRNPTVQRGISDFALTKIATEVRRLFRVL
jgi:hypothetical protein